jgi:hypothetical protein
LKVFSLPLPAAAVALLTATAFIVATVAQAPQTPQPPPGGPPNHEEHHHPAPTNLKVLPKNLTGEQVHEIMEKWAGSLGTHCDHCHKADPNNIGPNGRPRLDFADDSKPEKATARLMFKMTEDVNQNYVSMVDNSGAPVTCGTCHRGHPSPEPFVVPDDDHPRPGGTPPAGGEKPGGTR